MSYGLASFADDERNVSLSRIKRLRPLSVVEWPFSDRPHQEQVILGRYEGGDLTCIEEDCFPPTPSVIIFKIFRHFADKIFKGDHHEYPGDSSFENGLFEDDPAGRSGAM